MGRGKMNCKDSPCHKFTKGRTIFKGYWGVGGGFERKVNKTRRDIIELVYYPGKKGEARRGKYDEVEEKGEACHWWTPR